MAALHAISGVHRVGLALVEGAGRRLLFTATDRLPADVLQWCFVDGYDDVPLNVAVSSGRSVLGPLGALDKRYRMFVQRQRGTATVAMAAVPIVAASQVLGGYVVFFERTQKFDHAQRLALSRQGELLGAALVRARIGGCRGEIPTPDLAAHGAAVAEHDVRAEPAAVSAARGFLRTTLEAWGVDPELTESAVLCLSEVVTNAVVHAHAGCVVRASLADGVLTTTVQDSGAPDPGPADPSADPLRVHGYGLQVLDALASRWGCRSGPSGTTVWFDLIV